MCSLIYDASAVFSVKREYDALRREALGLKTIANSMPVESLYEKWTKVQLKRISLLNMVQECRENPLSDADAVAVGLL